MADQKEVVVYVRRPSWRWWLTKRLLRRSGYYFKVIDATNNSRLCSSPVHYMGRETMPYVSIDHRPVGGLSELKTLERSGALENLVRGGVQDATEAVKMAHEVIRNGAATLRLDEPVEKVHKCMRDRGASAVLVTTPDGKLVGLLSRENAERLATKTSNFW